MSDDGSITREFSFEEFVKRLGLPPGSTVTSIGMIWFDLNYGTANNRVRVHYRPGQSAVLAPPPLEDRLRALADLVPPRLLREVPAVDKEGSHADHQD